MTNLKVKKSLNKAVRKKELIRIAIENQVQATNLVGASKKAENKKIDL